MSRLPFWFVLVSFLPVAAPLAAQTDSAPASRDDLARLVNAWRDTEQAAAVALEIATTTADRRLGLLAAHAFVDLLDFVPPDESVVARLEAAALADPVGWRRANIAAMYGTILRHSGDFAAIERHRGDDGFLRDWMVIGPFGFEANAFVGVPFPPERRVDFSEELDGFDGKVRWLPYHAAPANDAIRPFDVLHPRAGVAYACAQFHLPAELTGTLALRCNGSTEIFVDGVRVGTVDRNRAFLGDSTWVGVRLSAGWHTVLVKSADAESHEFSLQLRDATDAPVVLRRAKSGEGVQVEDEGQRHPTDGTVTPPAGRATFELVDIRARAGETDERPAAFVAAALVARHGLPDHAFARIERWLDAPDLTAVEATLAIGIVAATQQLPDNDRKARLASLARRALQADPDCPVAITTLAQNEQDNDRGEKGLEMLAAAITRLPRCSLLRVQEASILQSLGFEVDHDKSVDALLAAYPAAMPALDAKVQGLSKLGTLDRWMAAARKILSLRAFDGQLRSGIASRLIARRDFPAALAEIEFLRRADPHDPSAWMMLAALRHEQADFAGETAVLQEVAQRFPAHTAAIETLARRATVAGHTGEALTFLKDALVRDPNLHHVRREIARLEPPPVDWFREYDIDPVAFLKSAPGSEAYADSSVALLLDFNIVRVNEDGTSIQDVHQLQRLQDPRGKDELGTIEAGGDVIAVRTIKPDGTVLLPNSVHRGAYEMAGLEPGVIVEKHYRTWRDRNPGRPGDFGGFYFQDTRLVQPFHYTRFVVIVPKKLGLEPRVQRFPGKWKREERGDDVVYDFLLEKMPRIVPEPLMPDPNELVPYVEFRQPDAWSRINRRYLDEWEPAARPTPLIVKQAREIVTGETDPIARAHRLYDWVMDTIVSEDGRGMPTQTLLEKSGDRFALLFALLRAADVPCQVAMGRAQERLSAPIDWAMVNQGIFDTPLIRIAAEGRAPLYLTTAARWAPFATLPFSCTDAPVFVCSRDGGSIERTPPAPSESGGIEMSLDLELDDAGVAKGRATARLYGIEAAQLKEYLERAEKKKVEELALTVLVRELARFNARATSAPKVENVTDRNQPLLLSVELEVKKLLKKKGDGMVLQSPLVPLNLSKAFVDRAERRHPLWFHNYLVTDHVANITLSKGWNLDQMPEGFVTRGAMGSFTLRRSADGQKVTLRREVRFEPAEISPQDFPKLARFLKEIDEAEARQIVLKKLEG